MILENYYKMAFFDNIKTYAYILISLKIELLPEKFKTGSFINACVSCK